MKINYYWALERFKQGRFEEIVQTGGDVLKDNSAVIPSSDKHIKLADITLRSALMLGDRERADGLLHACGNLGPLSHFRAATEFHDGRDDAAWFSLANATPYNPDQHGFWSLGLNSVVRSSEWRQHAERESHFAWPRTERLTSSDGDGRADYAIVFSSDSGYFKRFFEQGLSSLRRACSGFVAYYHVIEPDEECLALMREHAASDTAFLIEWQAQRPGDESYYASARFFAAHEVLRETGLPTFIFDIDLCVLGDLGALLKSADWQEKRIACRFMGGLTLPWQKIVANAMYVPPTRDGRGYLEAVCSYLRYIYGRSAGERLWWIDQNALFFAYLTCRARSFVSIPGWFVKEYVHYPKMFEDKDAVLGSKGGTSGTGSSANAEQQEAACTDSGVS